MKTTWSFLIVDRSTVSPSSFDSAISSGRASEAKSVRTDAARRRMVGPSRILPFGDAAMTSFSTSSAAMMRCTVERARSTRCAICPRLRPAFSFSSARRMAAARAITWTWLFSLVSIVFMLAPDYLNAPAGISLRACSHIDTVCTIIRYNRSHGGSRCQESLRFAVATARHRFYIAHCCRQGIYLVRADQLADIVTAAADRRLGSNEETSVG